MNVCYGCALQGRTYCDCYEQQLKEWGVVSSCVAEPQPKFENHLRTIIERKLRDMQLKDYSTEELERLTTLTEATAKPGEYCRRWGFTLLRLADGQMSDALGNVASPLVNPLERRVRSFTDPTELDPPQSEMLAELERRWKPVISNKTHAGRHVRSGSGDTGVVVSEWAARRLYPSATNSVVWVDQNGSARILCMGSLELL